MTDDYRPSPEVEEIVGTVQEFGLMCVSFPDLGDAYITARRAWLAAAAANDQAGIDEASAAIERAIELAGSIRGADYTGRDLDTIRYLARTQGRT
jgi:hypothetical protein